MAGTAGAATYTLSAPIVINAGNNGGSGVLGTILPETDSSGGSLTLAGVGPGGLDLLLFRVQLSAGSADVDQVGASTIGVAVALGAGHFLDPDETPTGGSIAGDAGLLDYDHLNLGSALNLEAGETTDRLFVTFALGALPGPGLPPIFPPGTASFMISSGANFSVQGGIVLIPEPTALLLLGSALALLAFARRR